MKNPCTSRGRPGPSLGAHPLRATVCAALLFTAPALAQNNSAVDLVKSLFNQPPAAGLQTQPTPESLRNAALQAQAGQAAPGEPMSADLGMLFAKGTVNGAELVGTLRAMQEEMRMRKAAKAAVLLGGALDTATTQLTSGNFNISDTLKETAVKAAIELVKQSVASAASKALDDYLQSMLDDPAALAAETVKLPPPAGMNATQAKRVVTMAALVVGAKVTGKLLKRAQKDLEGLKTDFGKVIHRREEAAKLLFAAMTERNKALAANDTSGGEKSAELAASLSQEDMAFMERDLGKLKVGDFAKDMAAQNLALSYLQRVQPEAFKAYRTETDDVVRRTKTYLQTMTGIVAFGAMTANFVQAVGEAAKEKQQGLGPLLMSLPMMLDFVYEAAPLAKVAVETAAKGVELGASSEEGGNFFTRLVGTKKSFVFVDGDKPMNMASAKDVFAELNKREETAGLFKGALFRSDAPGMLQRIGECDRPEAGRMVDLAVSKSEREEFAAAYFNDKEKADGFTFVNAMESPGTSLQEQQLPAQLLTSDHRERTTADAEPLSRVQLRVSEKYGEWGDNQLMRLIFANREGQARHATLYLGSVAIRPVPSPQAVFVYETAAEACKTLVVKPPPPPPKAAPVPPPPDAKKDAKGKKPAKPAPKAAPAKAPVKKEGSK
ncbi:hypothetical protein [Roseateles sp. LYH14W]|uniref:Uncharacterized protein n=1 Tax=Pelomonas parva TaxID=3299032 RepID=A0ABW7F743_9BURK